MGALYVVGAPMDNLEDVTLRALRVLRQAGLIVTSFAPDRVREFLDDQGIDTPLVGGQDAALEAALQALSDHDVALVAETASPAVTDLAHRLVRLAVERDIPVASVPGPSAAVTALVLSGLPADAFVCLGRLPPVATGRRALFDSLAAGRRTLVAFETSGRLLAALRDVAETLGDRSLALVREPARLERLVWRGTVQEATIYLETNPPSGEWALVVGGAADEAHRWPEAQVRAELARLLAEGASRKAAARQVAEVSGWRPREVYRLAD